MNKLFTLFSVFCWLFGAALAQSHFVPVPSTGLPYTIIVLDISVNGTNAALNTEIAVFDDSVCVGAAVYTGTFPVTLTAWKGNPSLSLPGFTSGRPMIIKIYSQTQNIWKEFSATATYEMGDGLFGTGAYSSFKISLLVSSLKAAERTAEQFRIRQYPNPFNGELRLLVDAAVSGDYDVILSSVDGKILHQEKKYFSAGTKQEIGWNAASFGLQSSSCYIITVRGNGRSTSIKSLYLK